MKTEPITPNDTYSTQVKGKNSARRTSLLLALAGFSLFSLGDGISKSIGGLWPGTAFAALRFFFGACMLAVLVLVIEGRAAFTVERPALQLARGAAMAISTTCFFVAVQFMPLTTATAIAFMTPLLTALLSALFLKEHVSVRIWTVVMVAFVGVIIILRPNISTFGPVALLPLGSALGLSFLMILNRAVADSASALASQMLVAVLATPILIAITLAMHMSGLANFQVGALSWTLIGRAAVLACTATMAHGLIYLATIRSSAATIAPANYVQILFAVVIGWTVFGDVPDAPTFIGSAMIIGAGLWLFRPPAFRR